MPKQVDRDAVALIRSKMSRLVTMEHYDETMRDTGLRYCSLFRVITRCI